MYFFNGMNDTIYRSKKRHIFHIANHTFYRLIKSYRRSIYILQRMGCEAMYELKISYGMFL